MKFTRKDKLIILIILGIFFAFSPIGTTNLVFNEGVSDKNSKHNDTITLDNGDLRLSKVSERIYINNNWAEAKAAGICTGEGTYSNPYIIEDLIIDGGGSGNFIFIENSNDVYFKIENCTLYNALLVDKFKPTGGYLTTEYKAGIRLSNVRNSQINMNNCSGNAYGMYLSGCSDIIISGNTVNTIWRNGIYLSSSINCTISGNTANYYTQYYGGDGIYLSNSNYNTISGNTANNNRGSGIHLVDSNYNTILGNTANNNPGDGIYVDNSDNNIISGNTANNNKNFGIDLIVSNYTTVSGNIMNECGLGISGNLGTLLSNDIDTTNLVNGKPLYYYKNEVNLGPNDFTNAGQSILVNCHDSVISNLDISYTSNGISLYYCNNNIISDSTVNNNQNGVYLEKSNHIKVWENIANNNKGEGIWLVNSNNNTISGNTANNNSYGIYLGESDDNTISGSTADKNTCDGIILSNSNNNNITGNNASFNNDAEIYIDKSNSNSISGNTLISNTFRGINLFYCSYNLVSGNIMNACGLLMSGTLENLGSHTIDAMNLVNGKPLYYYTNEINLGSGDFLNAGQVILVNCDGSLVSNLNLSQCLQGISLYHCYNNQILGNTANFNIWSGIYLIECENNNISGNTANNNDLDGIYLHNCDNNLISENAANNNGQNGVAISGHYNSATDNSVNNNDLSGIYVFDDNNTISGNTINNNNYGIYVETKYSGNILYFNNFSNNIKNLYLSVPSIILNSLDKFVYTYNGVNYANHLGNYWDNYTGIDANNDGIGDTPFSINGFIDDYPLMEPIENYVIIRIHEPDKAHSKIYGYNLFFLLSILSIVAILLSKKLRKS